MMHTNSLGRGAARMLAVGLLALTAASATWAEEVTLAHHGLTLNGNLERAGNADLSGGVVLMVHGTLMHNRMEVIRSAQDLLTENGVASLAINLSYGLDNRHGTYDCQVPHRHTSAGHVDEILRWTQWLADRGAQGVVLFGHSTGANLALAAAVRNPPRLAGAVLMVPNTSSHERIMRMYAERSQSDPTDVLLRAKALVDAGRGDELMTADVWHCPRTQVSARTLLDRYRANPVRHNVAGHLNEVSKPTLVIIASDDEIQPNIEAYVLPEVDGDRVRLHVVEDSGHFFRDLNLEDAMDVIVPFVEEIL